MAKQGKDLSVVHLEVDAVDSLEAIVVHLGQVCDLQILVLKLHSGHLGRHSFIVGLIDVFKFKWVVNLVVRVTQSAPTLELLLV